MVRRSGLVGTAILLLPVAELAALIVVGRALGFLWTVLLFVLLSLFGVRLFRLRVAAIAATTVGAVTADAEVPREIASGVLALLGAALVVLPGFITGVVGLLLQFAVIRALLTSRVTAPFTTVVGSVGTRFAGRGDVIDVDVVDSGSNSPPFPSSPELS